MTVACTVAIRTGKRLGSGTDAKITVSLSGTLGESRPHNLDKWLHDHFTAEAEYTVLPPDKIPCGITI